MKNQLCGCLTLAALGLEFWGREGLSGPQCSGLLLGRKGLIEAAMRKTSPWEGAVCRAMKVGKEEVIGFLTAIETWPKNDLNALNREWNARIPPISTLVKPCRSSRADRDRLYYSNVREPVPDTAGNRYPTQHIS